MKTRRTLLDAATERLGEAGIENVRRNAEWMLEGALGLDRTSLLTRLDEPVTAEEAEVFETMMSRRLKREPLQYVIGHADFYGIRLRVTPAVLIPRPETEELVEAALERLEDVPKPWVLDLGTGSGAIALALKHERPDAEVFACDLSEDALAVAAENADRLALDVSFIRADILAPVFAEGVPPCFDLLVSNPPYVPDAEAAMLEPEVRDFEPPAALFTGDDPLVHYRAIAGHAARVLKPGGLVVVETHADYADAVRDLLAESGFADAGVKDDLAGRPRIAWGHFRS
ncbi:MAG: peptide chain release factor N(5)-glutamine methyltransferase [Bacteroidota bacterium]